MKNWKSDAKYQARQAERARLLGLKRVQAQDRMPTITYDPNALKGRISVDDSHPHRAD